LSRCDSSEGALDSPVADAGSADAHGGIGAGLAGNFAALPPSTHALAPLFQSAQPGCVESLGPYHRANDRTLSYRAVVDFGIISPLLSDHIDVALLWMEKGSRP
jgi:hypothetical protein